MSRSSARAGGGVCVSAGSGIRGGAYARHAVLPVTMMYDVEEVTVCSVPPPPASFPSSPSPFSLSPRSVSAPTFDRKGLSGNFQYTRNHHPLPM